MPSNLDEKKISELVREAIADQLKRFGETRLRDIPAWIRENYPDAVSTYSESLFDSAVARKASGQLKSWFAISLAGTTQLSIPGIPDDVLSELPPTIVVPDGKNDPRHVLLNRVTVDEFRGWEKMLAEQIKADQRKHRAARFIVDKVSGVSGEMNLLKAFGLNDVSEAVSKLIEES